MYGWILEILQCRKPVPSEVVKLVKMAVWAAKAERILGTGVTVLAWVKTSRAHATCTVLESHGSGRRHASEPRDFTRTQVENFSGGVRSRGGRRKWEGRSWQGENLLRSLISTQILTWQGVRGKVWEGRLGVYTLLPLRRTNCAVLRKISLHPPHPLKKCPPWLPVEYSSPVASSPLDLRCVDGWRLSPPCPSVTSSLAPLLFADLNGCLIGRTL